MENRSYLTAGIHSGWTNTVMSICHIIHLALLSNRIPIIPPFLPHAIQLGFAAPHPGPSSRIPFLDVSEVFDLPHLLSVLTQLTPAGKPGLDGIIEWSELVDPNRREGGPLGWDPVEDWEEIGCWSQWVLHGALAIPLPAGLQRSKLKPTFTPLPEFIITRNIHPPHIVIPAAASFFTPGSTAMASHLASINGSVDPLPDQQLACVDGVYYATYEEDSAVREGWKGSDSPLSSWNMVGKYLRWTDKLLSRAFDTLRDAFDAHDVEFIPSFVSVHIRHGDFLTYSCPFRLPSGPVGRFGLRPYDPKRCLPLSSYAIAVESIRSSLINRPLPTSAPDQIASPHFAPSVSAASYPIGPSPDEIRVLVTTDSEDPELLDAVRARGWSMVPKETSDRLRREDGDWYPMLVENVLLSLGKGFVGTEGSTMSYLSGRRVQDWNDGPEPIYIKWRSPR